MIFLVIKFLIGAIIGVLFILAAAFFASIDPIDQDKDYWQKRRDYGAQKGKDLKTRYIK